MECPECNEEMEKSLWEVLTYPVTIHYFCKACNAKWDVSEGKIVRECFQSPRKREELSGENDTG